MRQQVHIVARSLFAIETKRQQQQRQQQLLQQKQNKKWFAPVPKFGGACSLPRLRSSVERNPKTTTITTTTTAATEKKHTHTHTHTYKEAGRTTLKTERSSSSSSSSSSSRQTLMTPAKNVPQPHLAVQAPPPVASYNHPQLPIGSSQSHTSRPNKFRSLRDLRAASCTVKIVHKQTKFGWVGLGLDLGLGLSSAMG